MIQMRASGMKKPWLGEGCWLDRERDDGDGDGAGERADGVVVANGVLPRG